jgi:hypothetical protein
MQLAAFVLALVSAGTDPVGTYLWNPDKSDESIATRFAPPAGFHRVDAAPGSFGAWLRGLPLLRGRPPVHLFDGSLKGNQAAHAAVIDIDVGNKDLQQCADAVIRLRAEWLFSRGAYDRICFHATSGDTMPWPLWKRGQRARVKGNHLTWADQAKPSEGHETFRRYLDVVFDYAGTMSLEKELAPVAPPGVTEIGDVFVKGGSPGHAVIVVDAAEDDHGRRVFLLAQSYMPAQQVHVLVNPAETGSAWYGDGAGPKLVTPEWEFVWSAHRRFPDAACH